MKILSLTLCIMAVGLQISASEEATTFGSTDGSSITLKKGYKFIGVGTVSEIAPKKKYASLQGPIYGEDSRARKFVQGQVIVVTYPGVTLLEKWESKGRPDPNEIILSISEEEKELIYSQARERGHKARDMSEDWIEFLGRKTLYITATIPMPSGTLLYVRVIVFRAHDSFYTIKCISLGRKPDGWASATIESISDGVK